MKKQVLDKILRDYPWLWAIRQSWDARLIDARICQLPAKKLIDEIGKAWQYAYHFDRGTHGGGSVFFIHGFAETEAGFTEEFTNSCSGHQLDIADVVRRPRLGITKIDFLATVIPTGSWQPVAGVLGGEWVETGKTIRIYRCPKPWPTFNSFLADESVQRSFATIFQTVVCAPNPEHPRLRR